MRLNPKWLIVAAVGALVLFVGGPFVYIHFIAGDAPERLSFESVSTTTTGGSSATSSTTAPSASAGGVDGSWTVDSTSIVGYRINEVLFGQSAEAVGRTSDVTGGFVVDGNTITSADFTVDMTTVASNQSRRDGQFQGRVMETSTYPTSTFTLTEPITLDAVPADLEEITAQATGDLTLHGVTKSVTFDLTARRNGATIEVNGTIPILFADYSIEDPSFGPASVEDHGELEFILVLKPA